MSCKRGVQNVYLHGGAITTIPIFASADDSTCVSRNVVSFATSQPMLDKAATLKQAPDSEMVQHSGHMACSGYSGHSSGLISQPAEPEYMVLLLYHLAVPLAPVAARERCDLDTSRWPVLHMSDIRLEASESYHLIRRAWSLKSGLMLTDLAVTCRADDQSISGDRRSQDTADTYMVAYM